MMGKSLTYAYPQQFEDGGAVKMTDVSAGKNEQLGNDMVLLTFADGSKRMTQKALYEAADSLGAFDNMSSGDDFADWHLNTWAGGVVSDPQYKAAHDQFNTSQIGYNNALMEANPEIAQNRLAFVQQHAPNNQAALDAAQQLVSQYSGGTGINYNPDSLTSMDNINAGTTAMDSGIGSLVQENQDTGNTQQQQASSGTYGTSPTSYSAGMVGDLSPFYRPPSGQASVPTAYGSPINTQQVVQQASLNSPFRRPT